MGWLSTWIAWLTGGRSIGPTYTVQRGDTLSGIAQKTLGHGERYPEIFALNRDQLANPDQIQPGQVLKLPRR